MDAIWVLVPITMFVAMGLGHALRGPLGRAIADRIGGRAAPRDERLEAEVEELRQRVAELEERQDFTDRMLANQRDRQVLERGG